MSLVLNNRVKFAFSDQRQRYSKTEERCKQRVTGGMFVVYMENDLSSKMKYAIKNYTLELVIIE